VAILFLGIFNENVGYIRLKEGFKSKVNDKEPPKILLIRKTH